MFGFFVAEVFVFFFCSLGRRRGKVASFLFFFLGGGERDRFRSKVLGEGYCLGGLQEVLFFLAKYQLCSRVFLF